VTESPRRVPQLLRSRLFWVGILNFSEGFPLDVFYDVIQVAVSHP